jgi:hypothetical protein
MGCWLSFRGSLTIEPPITKEDKESYRIFSKEVSFPANPKANYIDPWFINDEGRLECYGVKYFEHDRWMEYIFEKFFEPKGYEVHGSLLYAVDGSQTEWSVLRYDNGKVFHVRMEEIHVDLDFWQMGAKYAREQMAKRLDVNDGSIIRYEKVELAPESYGGLFEM